MKAILEGNEGFGIGWSPKYQLTQIFLIVN